MNHYYLIYWYSKRGFEYILFEQRGDAASFCRLLKERARPYDTWRVQVFSEHEWNYVATCKTIKFDYRLGEDGKTYEIDMTKSWR
jgi:hypothetical protein